LQIVAGITLKSLGPQVWDESSPYYLPSLGAVMISYADFHHQPAQRRRAMELGIHKSLSIPTNIRVYLDNGAFYFSIRGEEMPIKGYEEFVEQAHPDWRPVPRDFIPIPNMTLAEQRQCLNRTMHINRRYQHNGYVPVAHISQVLNDYVTRIKNHAQLSAKPAIALGGIVPNLLRASKAMPYKRMLDAIKKFRRDFADKQIHVFGIGGTATLHLAALLGINSVDSSGWRNRAARGIIQLPGSGERIVAELGSWKGRELSEREKRKLRKCPCPACQMEGLRGLKATGVRGFRNRATHNLSTLLEEARWIKGHLAAGTYPETYKTHLDNTIYRPLIEYLVKPLPEVH
jgi:7-cyano-7-deazaguanine tRNA-ribosyltransferase